MSEENFTRSIFNDSFCREINYEEIALAKYNSWILTGSIWPVTAILFAYLAFVLKIGPEFMKNRKPLEIKKMILVYNLFQAAANVYLLSYYAEKGIIPHLITHACHPMERSKNPYLMMGYNNCWFFLFTKILDLLDTVFFVLRKKQSHVTFLHLYHHTCMVFFTWFVGRYFLKSIVIASSLNVFIHVIMYSYYFLAALGPRMQKYLWWKIYLTKLQMIQFVILITFVITMVISGCNVPSIKWLCFGVFQLIVFLVLFGDFYYKTYVNRKSIHRNESFNFRMHAYRANNKLKEK